MASSRPLFNSSFSSGQELSISSLAFHCFHCFHCSTKALPLVLEEGSSGNVTDASQAVLKEWSPCAYSTRGHSTPLWWFFLRWFPDPASWGCLLITLHPSPCPRLCFQGQVNEDSIYITPTFLWQLRVVIIYLSSPLTSRSVLE